MDYKIKYLKYKSKYLNLKNIQFGGNPLKNDKKGYVYTKKEWDKESESIKKEYDYYCPESHQNLCTDKSNSIGLCKKNLSECDDENINGVIPEIHGEKSSEGEKFGYSSGTLFKRCNKFYKDYEYTEKIKLKNKKKISVCTYNIWGLYRPKKDKDEDEFYRHTIDIRINAVVDELIKNKPDIVCFQEMTNIPYEILSNRLKDIYPYHYEKDFNNEKNKEARNRDVEVHIFSKFPAKHIEIYGLEGNLFYKDSLLVADFGNFIIFNCYLQAGSKKSPGQEKYWFHYSRCRKDQIKLIKELIDDYTKDNKEKGIIVVGDFNMHLDGPEDEWFELTEIKNMGLNDSWRDLYPNKPGFTENTKTNRMRWNLKFQEKKLRYDGILYKNIKPIKSKIIGTNPILLNKEDTDKILKYWYKKTDSGEPDKRIKFSPDKKNKELLELFPSDHFGVITKFHL
jgi:exonuclease III